MSFVDFDSPGDKPAGGFVDFSKPAEPRSLFKEAPIQGYSSLTIDLPKMVGRAMQYMSSPGQKVYDQGKSIADWADQREQDNPDLAPQYEGRGLLGRALTGGARAIPASLAAMLPAAAGAVAAPLVGAGALTGAAVGSAAAAFGLFGASQGQETYDKLLKSGVPEDEARKAGWINLMIEGGGETIGNIAGLKLFGMLGKAATAGASPVAGAIANATETAIAKPFLKQLPKTAAIEIATEFGQNYGEAWVENRYGAVDAEDPLKAGVHGAEAALGMTLLLAPFGLAGFSRRAKQNGRVAEALQNPDAPEADRIAASKILFDEINEVSPEAAKAWSQNSSFAIVTNAPILLDETTAQPGMYWGGPGQPATMQEAHADLAWKRVAEIDKAQTVDEAIATAVSAPEAIDLRASTKADIEFAQNGRELLESMERQAQLDEIQKQTNRARADEQLAIAEGTVQPPEPPKTALQMAFDAARAKQGLPPVDAQETPAPAVQPEPETPAPRTAKQAAIDFQNNGRIVLDALEKKQDEERAFREQEVSDLTRLLQAHQAKGLTTPLALAYESRLKKKITDLGGEPQAAPSADIPDSPFATPERPKPGIAAPKTVAGRPEAAISTEELQALADDPTTPAITRHAAVTAIQARAKPAQTVDAAEQPAEDALARKARFDAIGVPTTPGQIVAGEPVQQPLVPAAPEAQMPVAQAAPAAPEPVVPAAVAPLPPAVQPPSVSPTTDATYTGKNGALPDWAPTPEGWRSKWRTLEVSPGKWRIAGLNNANPISPSFATETEAESWADTQQESPRPQTEAAAVQAPQIPLADTPDAAPAPAQTVNAEPIAPAQILGRPVDKMTVKQLQNYATKGNKTVKAVAQVELDRRADEKAAKPLSPAEIQRREGLKQKQKAIRQINPKQDSILTAIVKMGGLDANDRQDITGDTKGNFKVPFVGALFSPNGRKIDELASRLAEMGYLNRVEAEDVDGGVQALKDKIADELAGRKTHYSYEADEAYEQEARRAADIAEDYAAEMGESVPPDVAAAAMSIADALAGLTPEEMVRFDALAETMSNEEWEAAVVQFAEDKANGDQRKNENGVGTGEADPQGPQETPGSTAVDQGAGQAEIAPAEPVSIKAAATAFSSIVDTIGRDRVSGILLNWNDAELSEDGERIVNYVGRDRQHSKGSDGGKKTTPKREFIAWLLSDAPFDEKVYGTGIDAEWRQDITDARKASGLWKDTETATPAAPALELAAQTPEELRARADAEKSAADKAAKEQSERDEAERKERERKEVKARSEQAAGTFELGQSAEDNLSGQQDIFSAPANSLSAPDLLRAAAAKMEEKPKPAGQIEDFGEKIEGARKDYAAAFKEKMAEASDIDIATEPLSKSWPEPDYQKLLEGGADPWAVAFMHAARDEVPTKPQTSWKLKGWVEKVAALRDATMRLATGDLSIENARKLLGLTEALRDVQGRVDLYQAVGHEKSLKGIRIAEGQYGIFNGVEYKPPKRIWSVEGKAKATAWSNWPTMLAYGDTREQAIENFKAAWKESPVEQESKSIEFDIYSRTGVKGFFIGKKLGANVVELKGGFTTSREAREWKAENQAELVTLLEKMKYVPNERRESNSPRVGEDHRNGANVTPEQFKETFGFRGGQFGNAMPQVERQSNLNETYDALMDLAGVLGIPPKALSLNGELALAFGARGRGGKNAPAAHYEPDATGKVSDRTVVINMTRERGAGSLAHEWFHAVDNYFARMRGDKGDYLSSKPYARGEGVRPEMVSAFKRLTMAINAGSLAQRSKKLDRTRSKPYWGTGIEMAARSFESYIIAKLQDQNASNDYLANIVSEDYWNAAAALGLEKEGTYPYPQAAEVPAIRAAFDEFFNTVQTKETDTGTALYSRSKYKRSLPGGSVHIDDLRALSKSIRMAYPIRAAASIDEWPADLRKMVDDAPHNEGIDAAFYAGEIWLAADHMPNLDVAQNRILHEGAHGGLRGLFGDKLDIQLIRIFRSNESVREKVDAMRAEMPKLSAVEATEEVLVNMAADGEAAKLKGWDKFVAFIRDWLRKHGFAQSFTEAFSDNDVLLLLQRAGEVAEGRRDGRQQYAGYSAFSTSYSREGTIDSGGNDGFWQRLASVAQRGDGFHFTDEQLVSAYSAEDRAGWKQGRVIASIPSRQGQEIVRWNNSIAGFSGYYTVGKWHGDRFELDVIPEALVKEPGRALYEEKNTSDQSILKLSLAKVDGENTYEIGIGEPEKHTSAYKALLAAGRVSETGQTSADGSHTYSRVNLGANFREMAGLLTELVRRAAIGIGDALTVVSNGRDTGANTKRVRLFSPEQVKARFSRANPAAQVLTGVTNSLKTAGFLNGVMASPAKLGIFNGVNTQYHKAEMLARKGMPEFKRVFDKMQAYLNDISGIAVRAEQQAPAIFRELTGIGPKSIKSYFKGAASESDIASIGPWLHQGTLYGGGSPMEGVVWTDDQLRGKFEGIERANPGLTPLTDKQIELYRQARAAIDQSLEDSAKSIIFRHVNKYGIEFDRDMSLEDVADVTLRQIIDRREELEARLDYLRDQDRIKDEAADIAEMSDDGRKGGGAQAARDFRQQQEKEAERTEREIAELEALQGTISGIEKKASDLIKHGYMPLMRFGNRTVTAYDKDGKVQFFGTYDGKPLVPNSANTEMHKVASAIRAEHPDWTVKTGVKAEKAWQMYNGLNLEALENFLDFLDPETKAELERDATIQEYLKNAVNNRSVMKRLIHRNGTPGFSTDIPRTLASFVTSNARNAAGMYNIGEAKKLVEDIPKEQGDIKDEAADLVQYVTEPTEEAAKLRGFLFFHFLGGSVAAAAVNLTQTVMMCVDEETEALTRDGWKQHADLVAGEDILAYDIETDTCRWSPLKAVMRMPHKGKVFTMESGQISARTTDGHRWPVTDKSSGKRYTVKNELELPKGGGNGTKGHKRLNSLHSIPVARSVDNLPATSKFSDAFVALMGWIATEGHFCREARKDRVKSYGTIRGIEITQSPKTNPVKVQAIRDFLNDEGIKFGERIDPPSGAVRFKISAANTRKFLPHMTGNKVPTAKFLASLPEQQLHVFIKAMLDGDGTRPKGTPQAIFFNTDKMLVDAFQMAVTLSGGACRVRGPFQNGASGTKPIYRVRVSSGRFARSASVVRSAKEPTEYDGTVWCPSVESGFWVARRNGTTYCTGNTLPYLAQHGSIKNVTSAAIRASKMAVMDPANIDGERGRLLQKAEREGITSPQQIYHLTATAANNPFSSNRQFRMFMTAWGGLFSAAEVFNRRVAFLSAYDIAHDEGMKGQNAYDFAARAVTETQGLYNKGNRPSLSRGTAGALVFTFKTFSIMYLELLRRLPPQQQLLMLGVLLVAAGGEGLPFAEDIEDLVDTLGQWLGFTTNTGKWAGKTLDSAIGKDASHAVLKGLGGMLPLDLHSRLGMKNLLPGTAFFKPSEIDKTRDVAEAVGPLGGVLQNLSQSLQMLARGKWDTAAVQTAPKAIRDAYNGFHMATTGESIDTKGRIAMKDVTAAEAFGKTIGFNPQRAAVESEAKREIQQNKNLRTVRMDEFASDIADAIIRKDAEDRRSALEKFRQWNQDNPEMRIDAQQMMRSVRERVKAQAMTAEQRFLKSIPKTMRPEARGAFQP